MKEFEQSFSFACPKFLSPVPPNYDALSGNYHKEPLMLQLKVFLDEVAQQKLLTTIRRSVAEYESQLLTLLALQDYRSFFD